MLNLFYICNLIITKTLKKMEEGYIFLDTETTMVDWDNYNQALAPTHSDNWPRLLQLAYIVTDKTGKEIARYNELIFPEGFTFEPRPMPFENIRLEYNLQHGVPCQSAINSVFGWIQKGYLPVGHNTDYDIRVCQAEDYRLTNGYIDIDNWKDTAKMAKAQLGMPGRHGYGPKLGDLYFHFFQDTFESHDSMADVEATMAVFFKMENCKK